MIPDFLRVGGRRAPDPETLLTALVNAYPNDSDKQRNLFFAVIIEDGALTRACIEHVFNDLAGGEHAGSQLSK